MPLAELVYEDTDTCVTCWGIVPPEGVTMVPEDGDLCTCKTPHSA